MTLNEQSRITTVCMVAGLGCFVAIVFLSVMSRLFFENYELAFSLQLPLTVSGDLGCLFGLLVLIMLTRLRVRISAIWGYSIAFAAAGLVLASLLKSGFIVPTSAESLLIGDFLSALFLLCYAYFWWMVYTDMSENMAVRRAAFSLFIGIVLFLFVSIVPVTFGRILGTIVLPLAMCLCFLPIVAGFPALATDKNCSPSPQATAGNGRGLSFPKVALVTIALSFFVADLELDLFPISLYYEGVIFETLPIPAAFCIALLLVFAILLYWLARRDSLVPLPFLYTTGFVLTALGYLITPYRLQGGFPLAASEAGRVIIAVFALVFTIRFMGSANRHDARRLFLNIAPVVFASMLTADVIVVVMQMQPGFDYGDFVFRTVFSGFSIAILVVLLLGPLPRTDRVFEPAHETSTPNVSLKDICIGFAQRYDLSARETEVLTFLASGRDVPYIEKELVLAKSTVKTHIKHIYEKCSVSSRQSLLDLLEEFKGQG